MKLVHGGQGHTAIVIVTLSMGAALGQEPPRPPPTPEAAAAAETVEPAAETVEEIEEIVVTGSAIRRRDLTTPAPLTTLDRADIDASGMASLGQIIQSLPENSGFALNDQYNNGGDGSTRVNLRGLGEARTLVLLNGRRLVHGGIGADASVDLNAIPLAIVERIEVLKASESAIYGSDAIAGVVNIITRKRFQGTEAAAYLGASTHADGLRYDLSVTTGIASSSGGAVFSVGYYSQSSIFGRARDWSTLPHDYRSYNWATGQISVIGAPVTPQGHVWADCGGSPRCDGNAAWQALVAQYPGSHDFTLDAKTQMWRPFDGGGVSDDGQGRSLGDSFNYALARYLVTPQRRYYLFANGDEDLGPKVRGTFEAQFLSRRSDQLLAPAPVFTSSIPFQNGPIVVSADNAYNPFGRDFVQVYRSVTEAGGRAFTEDVDTARAVLGLDGTIPGTEGWKWEASFNFGRTSATETLGGQLTISHLRNALGPSFTDASGVARCGTPGNPISGCVPLDFFHGAGSITNEQLAYVSYTGIGRGSNEQKIISASVTGKLFDIPWGGPVALAVGGQLDREDGAFEPDPIQAADDNIDGAIAPVSGGFHVVSGFAEVSATVLQNLPATSKLELTGAVRAGSYSTFGTFATYQAGLRWQVVPDLAIRGTVATAFRAPNMPELFGGAVYSDPSLTDPCDTSGPRTPPADAQCTKEGVPADFRSTEQTVHVKGGGNEELQPETAVTFTGGLVFTPRFLAGLSVVLDYFTIDIRHAIESEGIDVIVDNCYRSDAHGDCEKIHRDPTSKAIVGIDDPNVNIAGLRTAGLGFDVAYRFRLRPIGNIRADVAGTWLRRFEKTVAGDRVVNGLDVYSFGVNPSLKLNVNVTWAKDGWGAGATVRFVGPYRECERLDCQEMGERSRDVAPYATLNLQVSKALRSSLGRSELTVGVLNALDKDPPLLFTNGIGDGSDASAYDYVGRFFYARLTQAF